MPMEIDPGHPRFLGTWMAISWKLFGKSLAVSHWMMLPFVFGLIWQIHTFTSHFISHYWMQYLATILILLDPTLSSQLTLISPEPIQMFFFFLALNSIFDKNNILKAFALAFLGIVSYRGMMLCAGLFLIDLFLEVYLSKKSLKVFFSKELIFTYAFGAIPAMSYVLWRYTEYGWLITHPESPWVDYWHFVSFKEFILNIIILGQRYLDFGRAFIWLILIIGIIKYISRLHKNEISLILISILSCSVVILISLFSTNTIGHRYFLASYIPLTLLAIMFIERFKYSKLLYLLMFLILLGGNRIIYSDDFAQGWDSSLAHIPYWNLHDSAIDYMDENNISIGDCATFFPNCTHIDYIKMNGDMREFRKFNGKNPYVFYSNVYNLSDADFKLLDENYHTIKTHEKYGVRIEIMKLDE